MTSWLLRFPNAQASATALLSLVWGTWTPPVSTTADGAKAIALMVGAAAAAGDVNAWKQTLEKCDIALVSSSSPDGARVHRWTVTTATNRDSTDKTIIRVDTTRANDTLHRN
jgi:hypothetical protein